MQLDFSKDIVIRENSAEAAEAEVLWPGIRRPPNVEGRDDETASASREPWVDANGYRAAYLRAVFPDKPAVLRYRPDKLGDRVVPFDSMELAVIEAWTAGGNAVVTMEPMYREALERKDAKALAAWAQFERTVQWLRKNVSLFRQPSVPIVTAVVDGGAASAEIANLLYRRNASPALVSTDAIPAPDPANRLVIVAANLRQPSPETIRRVFAHAQAGARVVTTLASPDILPGKGRVVSYKKPITDPSEFALDVIDVLTHKQRAVRLWNAPAVVTFATDSPKRGERLMHLVNYGSPIDTEVQARVQGHFTRATLVRPEAEPLTLTTAKRGTTTEVQIPELRRLGVVIFG